MYPFTSPWCIRFANIHSTCMDAGKKKNAWPPTNIFLDVCWQTQRTHAGPWCTEMGDMYKHTHTRTLQHARACTHTLYAEHACTHTLYVERSTRADGRHHRVQRARARTYAQHTTHRPSPSRPPSYPWTQHMLEFVAISCTRTRTRMRERARARPCARARAWARARTWACARARARTRARAHARAHAHAHAHAHACTHTTTTPTQLHTPSTTLHLLMVGATASSTQSTH